MQVAEARPAHRHTHTRTVKTCHPNGSFEAATEFTAFWHSILFGFGFVLYTGLQFEFGHLNELEIETEMQFRCGAPQKYPSTCSDHRIIHHCCGWRCRMLLGHDEGSGPPPLRCTRRQQQTAPLIERIFQSTALLSRNYLSAKMNPLAWVSKKINAVSDWHSETESIAQVNVFFSEHGGSHGKGRKTHHILAHRPASCRGQVLSQLFMFSNSSSRNSFGFIRRAHYNLPAVATRCMVSTNTLKTFVVTGSQVLARIPAQLSISGSRGAGIQECA